MGDLQGLKVLIVDDDPDAYDFLAVFLAEAQAQVRTAGSCCEALPLLERFRPDVVISDIAMPGQDGYWLLMQLKMKDIPAVALTALPDDERDHALAAGFHDWLRKPVNFDRLLDVLMQFQPIDSIY